jgi:uncharacterized protein (TIGR02452 family)
MRNRRRAIAEETVAVLERGSYVAPSGQVVDLTGRLARAVESTRLYRPDDLADLLRELPETPGEQETRIEVTGETTLAAAHRLPEAAALNFASAKHPGGGFLSGAEAQEEALARSSGLYASLRAAPEFYAFHNARRDLLYSDHMIYSPAVPVFRDDAGTLLEDAYDVAFLTSAAPNRGAIQDPVVAGHVPGVLRTRVAKVLALAHAHGHRRLVLGAWGCGVFANDPAEVAGAFATHLLGDGQFAGRFEHVVFAVYDRAPGEPRLAAFQSVFAS